MSLTQSLRSIFDDLPTAAESLSFVRTKKNVQLPNSSHAGSPELVATNIFDAQMVTSEVGKPGSSWHMPILDFDFPVEVVKSSSGNSHVYIQRPMRKDQLDYLVDCLTEVGLLQDGVRKSWKRNGFLSLRLPWVKKGKDQSFAQQQNPELEQPRKFESSDAAPVQEQAFPDELLLRLTYVPERKIYIEPRTNTVLTEEQVSGYKPNEEW